jgi:signal transduction histidine kinase
MTLKNWFKRFHNRPLKIAAAFLLAIWFVFADRSYVSISEKHMSAVNQTADLLSMATRSKDRVMTESLLETLLTQGGATSGALCKGDHQVVGANQDLFGCKEESSFFESVLTRKIPGSGDLVLKAKFNLMASLSPILSILGFGLVLVLAGFYFIQVAQSRIEKDILGPLLNKLLSDERFEIFELHDLQGRVRQAKDLEAQKAVTLAIQENNEQVAHDIRSPISSITELLSYVDVKDIELKAALNKAIERANTVAKYLLSGEKEAAASYRSESVYDFSEVVNNIAMEKRPLFHLGDIEVAMPKHLYAESSLASGSLARVLSNIIDNAMLACDQKKKVQIFLTRNKETISIQVTDSGRGIPKEIAGKIGQKGVSFRGDSKAPGTGRGVYSAKKTLREIGGGLEFTSSSEAGTTVVITVPIKAVEEAGRADFVLIDNEPMVRMSWTLMAERDQKVCRTFSSIDEFLAAADSISRSTPIYLDSDLGDGTRGQDYAPLIRKMGFERIVLATAFADLHGTLLPGIDEVTGKQYSRMAMLEMAQ